MAATVEPKARAAVIVPTRNRPGSLARCLDALAQQQGISNLELVVVDDGSVEPGEVRAAVGSKARLLRSERPHGPSAARNLGARAARFSLPVGPAARVAHRQDLRLSTFLRQQFGYGRGAYRFRRRHASERRLEPPGFYAGLLRRGFSRGVVPGVLVGVAQGATAAGLVCEALARRQ